MEIVLFLALMIAMMWFITSRGKKQQAQARQRAEESLVPGAWVMTIGGFLGKVVEVDGDVVTLESPSGVETIWMKAAIKEPKEPPFAAVEEEPAEEVLPADGLGTTGPVVAPAEALEDTPPARDGGDDNREAPRA